MEGRPGQHLWQKGLPKREVLGAWLIPSMPPPTSKTNPVSIDPLRPDYLQTLRHTENNFLIRKTYIRNVSPLKSLNIENKELC